MAMERMVLAEPLERKVLMDLPVLVGLVAMLVELVVEELMEGLVVDVLVELVMEAVVVEVMVVEVMVAEVLVVEVVVVEVLKVLVVEVLVVEVLVELPVDPLATVHWMDEMLIPCSPPSVPPSCHPVGSFSKPCNLLWGCTHTHIGDRS